LEIFGRLNAHSAPFHMPNATNDSFSDKTIPGARESQSFV
jgi:hypothetical protein